MDNHLFYSYTRSKLCNTILFKLLIAVFFMAAFASADMREVRKFTYKGQPEDLNDSSVTVNEKMVAMSEYIYVNSLLDTSQANVVPSIFFVIDHSGSMYNQSATDRWGNRFRVSHDLIDTLKTKFPKAEVGISVFNQALYYNEIHDTIFKKCPQQALGAYIPLLGLNKLYGSRMGWEILKEYLSTDTVIDGSNQYVNLEYDPVDANLKVPDTHINAGFDAAKHAMLSSSYHKNNHYIIFLSDGIAKYPPGSANNYVQAIDVPTTYTIFFNDTNTAPPDLVNFNTNVQGNGYSGSNPSSNLWPFINSSYDTLMQFIMDSIITVLQQKQVSYPSNIIINSSTPNGTWDSTGFTFNDLFPLIGVTTPFVYDLTYAIYIDSITPTGDTIPVHIKDTLSHVEYDVIIQDGAPDLPDTFEVKSWQRELAFYYNGSPVTAISETMNPLELRFTYSPGDANYHYTEAEVEVVNTVLALDKESYSLTKNDTVFTGSFQQIVIQGTTPTVGDGTLQHYSPDTIIATFRNSEDPTLPLDTFQIKAPFILSGFIHLSSGYYFDNNANGYVDSIYVKASTDIAGGLTQAHLQEIMDSSVITFSPFRNFTINSYNLVAGGIAFLVTEDTSHDPLTSLNLQDKMTIKQVILTAGGWVVGGTFPIYDKVAPLIHWESKAAHLDDYHFNNVADTLRVKFSEHVQYVNASVPFYFKSIEGGVVYTATLGAVSQPSDDKMVFYVQSLSGIDRMRDGDSLWIHEGDCVADVCVDESGGTAHNYQNNVENLRRRLYVDRHLGSFNITRGYYYDNNADGFVDSILVNLTTNVNGGLTEEHLKEIMDNSVIALAAFRGFTVNSYHLVSGGFALIVEEDLDDPYTFITADDKLVISQYTVSSGEGTVVAGTFPIYDKVAPIIHWEEKSAYLTDFQIDSIMDTLGVKFSEPVKWVEEGGPFEFKSCKDGSIYTAYLYPVKQPKLDSMVFYVHSLYNIDLMRDGDSLWIKDGDRVADSCIDEQGNIARNYQNNKNNTRRRLWVEKKLVPYNLIPNSTSPINISNPNNNSIIPNNLIDIINQIDPNFINNIDLQTNSNGQYIGMIITITPDDTLSLLKDFKLKGDIMVFDAVGNQVVRRNRMLWWEEKKFLLWIWNGKNENSRNVGGGSYLAVVEIEEITESLGYQNGGPKQTKKIYIGVLASP